MFREREREREKEREREREREKEGCLNSVGTYLRGHCAAGVQLFKWCRNLSACTVLQGCSC